MSVSSGWDFPRAPTIRGRRRTRRATRSRDDREANRGCGGDCTATHNRNTVLIAGSGVLQGIGVGMVLASFLIPEKVATATIAAGPVKMQVVPTAGGMGAVGTF